MQELAPTLPADVPVYGLRAAGFLQDETALDTVQEMASLYLKAIREVQPEGPYRLVGWSFGGVVAYDIAQRLRSRGQPVEFVGIIDSVCPHQAGSAEHVVGQFDPVRAVAQETQHAAPAHVAEQLSALADEGDFADLFRYCQSQQFIPADLDEESVRRQLAVRHGIRSALARYLPPVAALPVPLFLAAEGPAPKDATPGWANVVHGAPQVVIVPGTHATMVSATHTATLGSAIAERLASGLSA